MVYILLSRYSSLRLVPAYSRLVNEKFARCLDLYLAPRARRMKVSLFTFFCVNMSV